MSEEEKKAIKYLDFLSNEKCECDVCLSAKKQYKTILKLIEKQQKEIEELKEKNKTLETLLQGTLYEMYLYYKDLASKYQANSISKDKIRKKIKELEDIIEGIIEEEKDVEDYQCAEYYQIQILEELLEE